MAVADSTSERVRLTVDVPARLKRRLRLAAAHGDTTLRSYIIETLEERLDRDLAGEEAALDRVVALSAAADPVLAELWANDADAAYDDL